MQCLLWHKWLKALISIWWYLLINGHWVPLKYPMIRLVVRYREISMPREWMFEFSHYCCRGTYKISERSHNSKHEPLGFETSGDLTIRRLIAYSNGASVFHSEVCRPHKKSIKTSHFAIQNLGTNESSDRSEIFSQNMIYSTYLHELSHALLEHFAGMYPIKLFNMLP